MELNEQRWSNLLRNRKQSQSEVESARSHRNKGFSFTRRTIAIAAVGAIVVLPLLASTLIPDMTLNYGWQHGKGGFWIFTDPREVMKFITLTGMTILPFHTHMIAGITGLYFGKLGK